MSRDRAKTADDVPDYKYDNSLDDWADRWEFKEPGWQLQYPNPNLVKYYNRLVDGLPRDKRDNDPLQPQQQLQTRSSRSLSSPLPSSSSSAQAAFAPFSSRRLRIFIPLCGKTRDLKWLYDRGDVEIVGIEWCPNIVDQLFQEAQLEQVEVTRKTESDGRPINEEDDHRSSSSLRIFQSPDGRFRVLCGDFFECSAQNVGGFVDAVWDRDAFSAVNIDDRPRYARQIGLLLKKGGKILMDTPLYDVAEYQGDPHAVTDEDIEKIFGKIVGESSASVARSCSTDSGLYSIEGSIEVSSDDGDDVGEPGEKGGKEALGMVASQFDVKLLEVVDPGEAWPKEYGMSSYFKRLHLLTKK